MLVLHLLYERPSYGYELCERICERSNGTLTFEDGAVYPCSMRSNATAWPKATGRARRAPTVRMRLASAGLLCSSRADIIRAAYVYTPINPHGWRISMQKETRAMLTTFPFGPGPDSSPNNPPIFIMNIIITLVILAILASPVVNAIRRALLYRYLQRHGIRVDATITSTWRYSAAMTYGTFIGWSGQLRRVYGANAKGVDPTTGNERVFTYRGIQLAGLQEGGHVIILIDPRKPSRYTFLR